MRVKVYSGASAPEALRGTVVQGSSGVDLSTVTSAVISVRLPDGTTPTWDADISEQTETSLVLTHTFTAAETAQLGAYNPVAVLTVPGGEVRAILTGLDVADPYGG